MRPNIELNQAYLKAFEHFNEELFGGILPRPMLCFSRNSNVIGGYFSPHKWQNSKGEKVHEIAINANLMDGQDIVKLMHVLIHEMIHEWQQEFGKPTRNGYHNKEWIEKANEIGLICKREDGKENTPGQAVQTFLAAHGKAELAIADLPVEAILPWLAIPLNVNPPQPGTGEGSGEGSGERRHEPEPERRGGKRSKYTCPICGLNAWAKPGVKIGCLRCEQMLVEAKA